MTIPISPNPELYTISKGVLEIAEIVAGVVGTYYDVGNCPLFAFEPVYDEREHYSSRTKEAELDASKVVRTNIDVEFELDEISVRNLQMFLGASLSGVRTLQAGMELNKYYALRFTSDNASGYNYKADFWKVKLRPNGRFNLIGDNWNSLGFSGRAMADRTNHAESPFMTMVMQTTTTTTTSSTTTTTTA